MRDLIAQRPNLAPTGLGHSGSGFDEDVLSTAPPAPDAPPSPEQADSPVAESISIHDIDEEVISDQDDFPPSHDILAFAMSDDDYRPSENGADGTEEGELDDDEPVEEKKKKKTNKGNGRGGKTPAQPGISTPTPLPIPSTTPKPPKKGKVAEFAEIAKNEEVTRQKELELAALKARHSLKLLDVKGRLGLQKEERRKEEKQARREERLAKLRIKEMKLRHMHDLRMAQLTRTGGSSHAAGFPDMPMYTPPEFQYSRSEGGYSHSEPDYSDFGGSSSAGPSSIIGSSFPDVDLSLPSFRPAFGE
ncbi:hypothetical protein C8R44DRAFT_101473 [Mycena epipterygia]|nr:hypothetical protein C8R44DRAFT_101473 [Mycena epipterygia]